jgi:hypothetical protein
MYTTGADTNPSWIKKTDISFQLRPSVDAITHAPERVSGCVKVENSKEVLISVILFDLCP